MEKTWLVAVRCNSRLTWLFCSGLCRGSSAGTSLDSETVEERGSVYNNSFTQSLGETHRTARKDFIFVTLAICASQEFLYHHRLSHHTNLFPTCKVNIQAQCCQKFKDGEIVALKLAVLVNMTFYFSCLKALGHGMIACRPTSPLPIAFQG